MYEKNPVNTPMIQLPTKMVASQLSLHPQTTQSRGNENVFSPLMNKKTPTNLEAQKLKVCKSPSRVHNHNFANMFERR